MHLRRTQSARDQVGSASSSLLRTSSCGPAVPVVGVYVLVSLAVVGTKKAKRKRYRVGEPWDYKPLWWTANPEGAHLPAAHARPATGRARRRTW